jgi:radical SAM protein with 4Fe4S-binding SPASM domain
MTISNKDDSTVPEYMKSIGLNEVEQKLSTGLLPEYGDRYLKYRSDYKKTLKYSENSLPDYPLTIHMELVNRCNLNCVMCFTVNHKNKKYTLMPEDIEKMAKDGNKNNLPAAIIGLGSESLLYKNIDQVFNTFKKNNVMDMFLYTNGVLLNEKNSLKILNSGVTRLHVSLDAATPETYLKIRRKDELANIENNLKNFIALKKKLGKTLPIVRVSFCVQDINLHEKQEFLNKWEHIVDRVDFQLMLEGEKDTDELIANGSIESLKDKVSNDIEDPYCALPFNSLSVWSDGSITPCCAFQGKNLVLGNIREDNIKEVWKGEKITEIRKQLLTGKDLNATCHHCIACRDNESFQE